MDGSHASLGFSEDLHASTVGTTPAQGCRDGTMTTDPRMQRISRATVSVPSRDLPGSLTPRSTHMECAQRCWGITDSCGAAGTRAGRWQPAPLSSDRALKHVNRIITNALASIILLSTHATPNRYQRAGSSTLLFRSDHSGPSPAGAPAAVAVRWCPRLVYCLRVACSAPLTPSPHQVLRERQSFRDSTCARKPPNARHEHFPIPCFAFAFLPFPLPSPLTAEVAPVPGGARTGRIHERRCSYASARATARPARRRLERCRSCRCRAVRRLAFGSV